MAQRRTGAVELAAAVIRHAKVGFERRRGRFAGWRGELGEEESHGFQLSRVLILRVAPETAASFV